MPVANATIIPGPPTLQVRSGDPVTLRCSVQVGSAPVTFTWLHNGTQVARGPLLELGAVHEGHSGTYQCVATNQLGQDGHRVFRALSPELKLKVTPQETMGHLWITGGVTRGHWDGSSPAVTGDHDVSLLSPAVAAGLGGSLLFLLLLVAGAVAGTGGTTGVGDSGDNGVLGSWGATEMWVDGAAHTALCLGSA